MLIPLCERDPLLADGLAALAREFRFDRILELLGGGKKMMVEQKHPNPTREKGRTTNRDFPLVVRLFINRIGPHRLETYYVAKVCPINNYGHD